MREAIGEGRGRTGRRRRSGARSCPAGGKAFGGIDRGGQQAAGGRSSGDLKATRRGSTADTGSLCRPGRLRPKADSLAQRGGPGGEDGDAPEGRKPTSPGPKPTPANADPKKATGSRRRGPQAARCREEGGGETVRRVFAADARLPGRPARAVAGPGALDRQPGQSADRASGGQPHLDAPLRPPARPDGLRLRPQRASRQRIRSCSTGWRSS